MPDVTTIRPRPVPFLIPRIVGGAVGATLLSGAVGVAAFTTGAAASWYAAPLLWVAVVAFVGLAARVACAKERYEIHPDRLIAYRGTLLSDSRSELDLRNVTHVRRRLPWLRHRFFGVGDVRVESAGSAGSEITFRAIDDPVALTERIEARMRAHGFALRRREVLHRESPTALGALTDLVQRGLGIAFVVVWVVLGAAGGFIGALQAILLLPGAVVALPGIVLGAGILGLVGFGAVVRYLDVTRRTYTVYDDAIAYTEGFLTRDDAFIPYENIADASLHQSALDRLLGLYDVTVSCQGSGSEIRFRRLSGGPALTEAIATLVARGRTGRPEGAAETSADPERPTPTDGWTAELRMNPARALVSTLVVLPLVPVWLVVATVTAIRATHTTYTVGPDSLERHFSFLAVRQVRFACDKVTGVQILRSPLDAPFGTMTLQIWSIGAPQPLIFAHVDAAAVDLPALLRQCGIPAGSPVRSTLSQGITPRAWLVGHFGELVACGALIAAAVATTPLLGPLPLAFVPIGLGLPALTAAVAVRRVRRQRITFHDAHVEARTGALLTRHTLVRYDRIKKVETVTIPFTDRGHLTLYVAGERVVQNPHQPEGATATIPYALRGAYLEGIASLADALDGLLLGHLDPADVPAPPPRPDAPPLATTRPAIQNAVVPLALVGLVVWPVLALLPLVWWRIAVCRYVVERDRVVQHRGILFKRVVSVLQDRIDTLQRHQGALGKAFGNGSVILLTAGSSTPDLVIANVPDHEEIYALLHERYGGGRGATP